MAYRVGASAYSLGYITSYGCRDYSGTRLLFNCSELYVRFMAIGCKGGLGWLGYVET